MSPTHANKNGVRYRYYTSQALLQGRKADAGSVARVSAQDVERLVADALRAHFEEDDIVADGEIIERRLATAEVRNDVIAISVTEKQSGEDQTKPDATILVAFTRTTLPAKGMTHAPARSGLLGDAERASLLTTIARSRTWIDELLNDPTVDFSAIAAREKLAERHVRFLAPLAYLSPRIIEAIAEGRAPAGLAVRRLARDLPLAWAEQECTLTF